MFTKNFTTDLEALIAREKSGDHFAFARFADGEHALLENKSIRGWDWELTNSAAELQRTMKLAFQYNKSDYYYGVSCGCCDPVKYAYYKNALADRWDRVSYSNMFANSNYDRSIEWLKSLPNPVVLANVAAAKAAFPFTPFMIYTIPSHAVERYLELYQQWYQDLARCAKLCTNMTFLVSCGPLSEIFIHWMHSINPKNTYIDVGSLLDPYMHGTTRDHHRPGSVCRTRTCTIL